MVRGGYRPWIAPGWRPRRPRPCSSKIQLSQRDGGSLRSLRHTLCKKNVARCIAAPVVQTASSGRGSTCASSVTAHTRRSSCVEGARTSPSAGTCRDQISKLITSSVAACATAHTWICSADYYWQRAVLRSIWVPRVRDSYSAKGHPARNASQRMRGKHQQPVPTVAFRFYFGTPRTQSWTQTKKKAKRRST
jgi:hypothetical protein